MLTTRWEPITGINRLHSEMSRMIHGLEHRTRNYAPQGYPPVNLWEDEEAYYLEAELPGLDLDHIDITVAHGNELSIAGERKAPELESVVWHRQERGYGSFSRQIKLPGDVDADKVSARFHDGVLTVTLPKSEQVKPRKIKISTD